MLIAIDHGNYVIKTPRFTFVSGLTEHSVKPPMTNEILEYGGRFRTLSSKRLPYMRDKTQDERFFIRKSAIVVALGEYLAAHPALTSPECKVEIKAVQNLSPEQLKEMVQKMLDERLETVDCGDAKEGTTIQFNDTTI